jgi:hypothetical protein
MVSIHNTHEYHNYISSLPVQTPKTNKNTILEYIQTNYPSIYNVVNKLKYIRNKLNNPSFKYTIFLPLSDFDYTNLLNNLYKGELLIDNKEYIIVSDGGTKLDIKGNMVNNSELINTNITVGNGIIHTL